MQQLLNVLAIMPIALAARMRRLERRLIARLTSAGADTAERAVVLENAGRVGRFLHRRLTRAGVLVPARNDRYYLDGSAYARFRGRRRRRAAVLLTLALISAAIVFFGGDFS